MKQHADVGGLAFKRVGSISPWCVLLPQADNINTIVKAAGITVEPYWPSLFAKLFSKKSVEDLICNVGAGVCSAHRLQL